MKIEQHGVYSLWMSLMQPLNSGFNDQPTVT